MTLTGPLDEPERGMVKSVLEQCSRRSCPAAGGRPAGAVHPDPPRGAVPRRRPVPVPRLNRDVARAIVPGSGAFIALIAAMTAMTAMTIDINLPAIPVTATDLGTSLTMAQLTVTVFFGGFAVGQLLWGLAFRPASAGSRPILDRHRALRDRHAWAVRWRPTSRRLLTLRVIQGIGAGSRRGARPGHHPRPVPGRRRWHASCRWSWRPSSLAPIVAPTIGAVILTFASWRWIFGFLAIYGAVVLVLAAVFLDETLKVKDRQTRWILRGCWGHLRRVFRDPRSRSWAAVVTLALGPLTIYLANSSAVLMAGLRPDGIAVRRRLRRRRGLLLGRQPVEFALGPPDAPGTRGRPCAGRECRDAGGSTDPGDHRNRRGLAAGWYAGFVLRVVRPDRFQRDHAGSGAARRGRRSAAAALGFIQTVVPALIASGIAALYDGTAVPMVAAMLLLSALGWLIGARHKADRAAASP